MFDYTNEEEKIMELKFTDVFWIINEEMFRPKYSFLEGEEVEYIHYQKVIPVYVKSIDEMYDGTTELSITPVDVRDGVTKNWKWSRSVKLKEIDVSVFTSKEKAINKFNKLYTKDERDVFEEKDQLRRLQQVFK